MSCINEAFEHNPGDVAYSVGSGGGRTDVDEMRACLDDEGCVVFCCCSDVSAEVVGAVVYNKKGDEPNPAGPVTINMLAVRPSMARRGIAGALVQACEVQAARVCTHAVPQLDIRSISDRLCVLPGGPPDRGRRDRQRAGASQGRLCDFLLICCPYSGHS